MSETEFIVAWSVRGEKEIDAELKRLDPDLFLDKEIDYQGGPVYYIVKHHVGSGHPPAPVLVWRDGDGNPKPLTHQIVEEVKRREGSMDGAVREVVEHNRHKLDKQRAEAEETYAGIVDEHMRRVRAAAWDSLPPNWKPRRFGAK